MSALQLAFGNSLDLKALKTIYHRVIPFNYLKGLIPSKSEPGLECTDIYNDYVGFFFELNTFRRFLRLVEDMVKNNEQHRLCWCAVSIYYGE